MNHLKRRSICKSCQVCFVRDNDIQVYCHSCLESAKYTYKSKNSNDKKCLVCHCMFISLYGRSTCSDHCKKEMNKINQKKYIEKEKEREGAKEGLTVEAKRWLDKKERKFIPRHSYQEINRRSEYNRVFGKYSESPLFFKRKGFGR